MTGTLNFMRVCEAIELETLWRFSRLDHARAGKEPPTRVAFVNTLCLIGAFQLRHVALAWNMLCGNPPLTGEE